MDRSRSHAWKGWTAVISVLSLTLTVACLSPVGAMATAGDLYSVGTDYQAATYTGHSNVFGGGDDWTVDINANLGDTGRPVFAPEAGSVAVYSEAASGLKWGNSLIWTSADGRESIHVAHLDSFVKSGVVESGDLIAIAGTTGNSSSSHMHVSRSVDGAAAPLVLSGHLIVPSYVYNGTQYRSAGPLKRQTSIAEAETTIVELQTSPSKPRHGRVATFGARVVPASAAASGTATVRLYRRESRIVVKRVRVGTRWKRRRVRVKYWRLRTAKTMTANAEGRFVVMYKPKYKGSWKMVVSYSGAGYLPSSLSKTFYVK
jgi:hypothetical protein